MKKLLSLFLFLLIPVTATLTVTPSPASAQGNTTCDQAGEPCCGSRTGGACLIGTGLICVSGTCRDPNALPDTTQCDQSGEACCTDPVTGNGFCINGLPCLSGTCQIAPPAGPAGPPQDGPWYNQTMPQFQQRVFNTTNPDEIFGERYTFAQVNWIINSLAIAITPAPGDPATFQLLIDEIIKLFAQNQVPTLKDYAQLGIPGLLFGSMAEMYSQPPASGVNYISGLIDKFDPTPVAHAQGYGYGATGGIRVLWTAARNTAYLIMIVLLITAGFMIMFRVKINPQTAVTLQLMIPKIIITLLLVTFSYAIAGFVIDLVFVLLSFVLAVLKTSGAYPGTLANAVTWFTRPDFGRVFWFYFLPWLVMLLSAGGLTALLLPAGLTGIGLILPAASTVLTIVSLIMTVFLLVLLFKVWWMLVKTYIQLLIYIIIGPWQIMLGLLPGQSGFGSWLRNMVAHASVFLVVPLMFMFNMFFWNPRTLFGGNGPLGDLSAVSDGTYPSFPLFGGKGGIIFDFAVGYAVLALTPKIAEIIRDALKVPPFKYGTAFGEALGPVMGPVNWGRGAVSGAGQKVGGEFVMGQVGGFLERRGHATAASVFRSRAGTSPTESTG